MRGIQELDALALGYIASKCKGPIHQTAQGSGSLGALAIVVAQLAHRPPQVIF